MKEKYRQEYFQENRKIPFDKNEKNKSIIASETIEPNASEKIEQITSNKTEQIVSKKVEASKKLNKIQAKKLNRQQQDIYSLVSTIY